MKFCLSILTPLLIIISCSKQTESVKPQRKDIVEAVYASGSIHARFEYKVSANATGTLRNLIARENDTVSAGTVLFRIESTDPELRKRSAQEALQYAVENASENSAALDELRSNLENTRAKYVGDSLSWKRSVDLLASGAVTRAELDRQASVFESSRALWYAAAHKLATTRQNLTNQVKLARKQLELAATTERNFEVQSRLDGRVYAIYKEEGELISSQQPVMLIGDARQFMLRLVIDASDVARIRAGQKVMYTVDAFPDSIFSATVEKVFPVLETETQSFRIDARCDQIPAVPFVGTQVQANIVISEKKQAVVIPRSYLQPNNQVMVREGSESKLQTVKTGISNLEFVEILSGLNENSIVVRK